MVARGDIVWADLGEPAGRRPVCVLTRDPAIDVLIAITCAPITRTIRGIKSEVEVGPAEGLPQVSAISCDNLIAVPIAVLELKQSAASISADLSDSTPLSATPSLSGTDQTFTKMVVRSRLVTRIRGTSVALGTPAERVAAPVSGFWGARCGTTASASSAPRAGVGRARGMQQMAVRRTSTASPSRCSVAPWPSRRAEGSVTPIGARRRVRTPNRARRLHYVGESCPVARIAHVCRRVSAAGADLMAQ